MAERISDEELAGLRYYAENHEVCFRLFYEMNGSTTAEEVVDALPRLVAEIDALRAEIEQLKHTG